jgi:hypothetical protein
MPLAQLRQQYRQYATAEIAPALGAAGFVVSQLYGDFDRSGLGPAAKKQIFVCTTDARCDHALLRPVLSR